MTGLSFGQVEEVLAAANNIAPERRGSFQARLKQWQKMGFPEGVNVGRGVRASYGAQQLFQLAFLVRLLAIGLTPERGQEVVLKAWPRFQSAIVAATERLSIEERALVYLMISLDALSPLQDPEADHLHIHATVTTAEIFADGLVGDPDDVPPEHRENFEHFQHVFRNALVNTIVLEIDSILIRVWLGMLSAGLDPALLADEFRDWREEEASRQRSESGSPASRLVFRPDNLADLVQKVSPFDLAARILPPPPEGTYEDGDDT